MRACGKRLHSSASPLFLFVPWLFQAEPPHQSALEQRRCCKSPVLVHGAGSAQNLVSHRTARALCRTAMPRVALILAGLGVAAAFPTLAGNPLVRGGLSRGPDCRWVRLSMSASGGWQSPRAGASGGRDEVSPTDAISCNAQQGLLRDAGKAGKGQARAKAGLGLRPEMGRQRASSKTADDSAGGVLGEGRCGEQDVEQQDVECQDVECHQPAHAPGKAVLCLSAMRLRVPFSDGADADGGRQVVVCSGGHDGKVKVWRLQDQARIAVGDEMCVQAPQFVLLGGIRPDAWLPAPASSIFSLASLDEAQLGTGERGARSGEASRAGGGKGGMPSCMLLVGEGKSRQLACWSLAVDGSMACPPALDSRGAAGAGGGGAAAAAAAAAAGVGGHLQEASGGQESGAARAMPEPLAAREMQGEGAREPTERRRWVQIEPGPEDRPWVRIDLDAAWMEDAAADELSQMAYDSAAEQEDEGAVGGEEDEEERDTELDALLTRHGASLVRVEERELARVVDGGGWSVRGELVQRFEALHTGWVRCIAVDERWGRAYSVGCNYIKVWELPWRHDSLRCDGRW
jgi:hypothetical protein